MGRKKKTTTEEVMESTDLALTNMKKSIVAQTKPRIGGRFVKLDENGELVTNSSDSKKKKKVEEDDDVDLAELAMDRRKLTDEEKEYIGTDPMRLLEVGLKNARTLSEGIKYAQALIKYKHPSLSAVKSQVDVEVTEKKLVWEVFAGSEEFTPISIQSDEDGEEDPK